MFPLLLGFESKKWYQPLLSIGKNQSELQIKIKHYLQSLLSESPIQPENVTSVEERTLWATLKMRFTNLPLAKF